jgi:RHS repeat-associated protein
MMIKEGAWSSSSYRFGFNGKEMDNETSGTGNQYDYGFRIYNPRLGKFLSVDPLTKSYPWFTPYQFAGNEPIWSIDLDGLEQFRVTYRSTNEGDATIKVVTHVNPTDRTNHPEYGTGGVEYVYLDGTTERKEDFVPGSGEEFTANLPQRYSENEDMSDPVDGTRRESMGNYINNGDYFGTISKDDPAGWAIKEFTVAKFDNASSKVLTDGSKIDALAKEIEDINSKTSNKLSVILIGHTDKDPMTPYISKSDPDGNLRLSLERAKAVKAELDNCTDIDVNCLGAGSAQADRSIKNPTDRKVEAVTYKENITPRKK